MSVTATIIAAPDDAAAEIIAADGEPGTYSTFSFKGIVNVKAATLLSLLSSQSADADYEKWTDRIRAIEESADGPWLFSLPADGVQLLSTVAAMEESEYESLSQSWAATEEFNGWEPAEVAELLRGIGDIAETAVLDNNGLLLFITL